MPENVSISGQVKGYDGKPVQMIRVTVYRDRDPASEVQREYTDEQGNYQITAPAGGPVTLRFDTHYSLTNAREWHPSVVANVEIDRDLILNRILLKVGQDGPYLATTDALAAYQFCAVWNHATPNRAYAEHAAARLGMIKFTTPGLSEIARRLAELFREQAQAEPLSAAN
jgi:hypothetical protein